MSVDEVLSLTYYQFISYLNNIQRLVMLDASIRAPYDPMVDHKKCKLPPTPSFFDTTIVVPKGRPASEMTDAELRQFARGT